MADDKKNENDAGDRTQQQPLRPPMPKLPQQGQGEAKPASDDHTVMGGGPPVMPKAPVAPPPAAKPEPGGGDRTVMGGGPPSMPKPGAAPAAAPTTQAAPAATPPPPPPPPSASADIDEGATVILARAPNASCSLQRLQPPGHGSDVVKLTQDSYVMGRSRSCDIQLFSPTASRQHARIVKRGDAWYLVPEEGRAVTAGGSSIKDEVRLVHKMRLVLGGDELLFFDEGAATAAPSAAPASSGAEAKGGGSRTMLIVGIIVAVVAAAGVAAWLFLNP